MRAAVIDGQIGLFEPDPAPSLTDCACTPRPTLPCGHCACCDQCQDCLHCAGPDCTCACEEDQ